MEKRLLPKGLFGRISVVLGGFSVGVFVISIVFSLANISYKGFVVGVLLMIALIVALITGILDIVRNKELSYLVLVSIFISVVFFIFMLSDIVFKS